MPNLSLKSGQTIRFDFTLKYIPETKIGRQINLVENQAEKQV